MIGLLIHFTNFGFGKVKKRVIHKGQTLVCGKDVARALGYKKPENAVAMHVDRDDTLKQGVIDSLGREQFTTFINESGLYSLILSSKLLNKNTLQEKLCKNT